MKKFLINVFLTLIPLLVLYPIDFIYSHIAMRSNHRPIEAWYDLMHGKIESDLIIMGNSRAWVHIDPAILDSILGIDTYNLGIDGSSINRQIQKYNVYRRHNNKPSIICQVIDFNSLGYYTGYEKEQFIPYFWDYSMRKEFLKTEPFSFWEKYLPMVRYRDYHLDRFRQTPSHLFKGYEGKDFLWNGDKYMETNSVSFVREETTERIFNQYLNKANSEGIKIVFVYPPIYIGATKKMTNLDEMYSVYRGYADKYEIPILDYTYMDICYDTTYFYNAMHLNKLGAELFSDSLANDIKKMGIIKVSEWY